MLRLWIVAIIITTTGWPHTPYLHVGFFLPWRINKEEEAGSSLAFHCTLVFGEAGCDSHTGIRQDKQEGAAGSLSFPASAAAAIFISCCPCGILPAQVGAGSTSVPVV